MSVQHGIKHGCESSSEVVVCKQYPARQQRQNRQQQQLGLCEVIIEPLPSTFIKSMTIKTNSPQDMRTIDKTNSVQDVTTNDKAHRNTDQKNVKSENNDIILTKNVVKVTKRKKKLFSLQQRKRLSLDDMLQENVGAKLKSHVSVHDRICNKSNLHQKNFNNTTNLNPVNFDNTTNLNPVNIDDTTNLYPLNLDDTTNLNVVLVSGLEADYCGNISIRCDDEISFNLPRSHVKLIKKRLYKSDTFLVQTNAPKNPRKKKKRLLSRLRKRYSGESCKL